MPCPPSQKKGPKRRGKKRGRALGPPSLRYARLPQAYLRGSVMDDLGGVRDRRRRCGDVAADVGDVGVDGGVQVRVVQLNILNGGIFGVGVFLEAVANGGARERNVVADVLQVRVEGRGRILGVAFLVGADVGVGGIGRYAG